MSDPTPHLPARFGQQINDLERRLRILETRAGQALGRDLPWTYPTDLASAITSNAANLLRFRKDALGFVHLQGGAANNSGSTFTGTLFTLPVGFRPGGSSSGSAATRAQFSVYWSGGSPTVGRIHVEPNGIVSLTFSLLSTQEIEASEISFFAEN